MKRIRRTCVISYSSNQVLKKQQLIWFGNEAFILKNPISKRLG